MLYPWPHFSQVEKLWPGHKGKKENVLMNHPPNSDGGETKGAPTKEGRNWDKEAGAMKWLIHWYIWYGDDFEDDDNYDDNLYIQMNARVRKVEKPVERGNWNLWEKKTTIIGGLQGDTITGWGIFTNSILPLDCCCGSYMSLLWYTIQLGNLTRLLNLLIPGDHHEPLQGKDGQAHNRLNPYKTNICHTMHCTMS